MPGKKLTKRSANLFDVLRIFAAALVIIGHAWPLTGLSPAPEFAGIRIHHLGVYIFFSISGYLLATSWDREPRAVPFLIRRCLRIFPALILVVILTVCVLGPAVTRLNAGEYWGDPTTWRYLLTATLVAQYELPGVFAQNPLPVVNGSLWSLGVEFCCYLLLVLTALWGVRARLLARGVLIVVLAAVLLAGAMTGPLRTTAIAVVFFLLGSVLARGAVLPRWPVWPALVGLLVILPLGGPWGTALAWPVVTYSVVAIGTRRPGWARWVRRAGDPSYGMYLCGFPIQQLLVMGLPSLPLWMNTSVVLILATLAGYASWHALERHAISLGARLTESVSRTRSLAHRTSVS